MSYGLLLDGSVVLLLATTIVFAIVLNRKLAVLRESKAAMEQLLVTLTETTRKADAGLAAIRDTAENCGPKLQHEVGKARVLCDELARLLEQGGALAGRLERAIGAGPSGTPLASASLPTAADASLEVSTRDEAKDLLRRLIRNNGGEDGMGGREGPNGAAPPSKGAALVRALRAMR